MPSTPCDTVIVTVRPLVAWRPPSGDCEITSPSGTESENSSSTLTLKPASVSACSASSRDWPSTAGTGTVPRAAGDRDGHRRALAHLLARGRILLDHLVARDVVGLLG